MLIVVEGCDGVGKTTLIEQLAERLRARGDDVTVLHRGVPERHPLVEYEDDLLPYRPREVTGSGGDWHILCDRWHWGELVYGPLYRQESKLGGAFGAGRLHVELFLRSRGAVAVHVHADEALVRERLRERGEDYLEDRHVNHVLSAFHRVASSTILPTVGVKSPHGDIMVERVLRSGVAYEREAGRFEELPGYIGHPYPRMLLVGEKTGAGEGSVPFVPYPSTSGHYLLSTLEWDPRYGLVNALEEDVFGTWWRCGRPPVVALGRVAQRIVRELEIPHGAAPHPQYVRRFHHNERTRYRRALEDAALRRRDVIDEWQTS